jgi:hypothetical protein
MTVTDAATARRAVTQLGALTDGLAARGFMTTLVDSDGGPPCVNVVSRESAHLSEKIYAAPAGDGSLWFWWSWAERIAPIDDVATTAGQVARVLTPHTT